MEPGPASPQPALSPPDKPIRPVHDVVHCPLSDRWGQPRPPTLGKHSWPCGPRPRPTSDPPLRTISRAAPCRRPHDLIKCNYHQLLVLGGGRRGGYMLEANIWCFCTFIYFHIRRNLCKKKPSYTFNLNLKTFLCKIKTCPAAKTCRLLQNRDR